MSSVVTTKVLGSLQTAVILQIVIGIAIVMGIIWALFELRSKAHRVRLKYSQLLPKIRSAQSTDDKSVLTMSVAIFSNIIFLVYLFLLLRRLKQIAADTE